MVGASAAATASPGVFRVIESQSLGRHYVETEGLLSSAFVRDDGSSGAYEAPLQLLYPRRTSRCSGVGVEDLANAAFFNFPGNRDRYWNIRFARIMLGDRFLMSRRVSYAAPTWDKKAVDQMGSGHIERREDGLRIVDDTSSLLRDPGSIDIAGQPEGFVPPTCRADTVVGYGFSDSASLLRTYFAGGNSEGVFDAGLIHTAGASCWSFAAGQAVESCPELPSDLNAKVISLDSETEVQHGGTAARQDLGDYRHYEIAGAAHLPKEEVDLMELARQADDEDIAFATATRHASRFQNPEAMAPSARAAFKHLVRWTLRGTLPPDNAYIDGSFDPVGSFTISRDRDGNALGGIRLPWLDTMLDDGSIVGAALGSHTGLDVLGGLILGGRYECFADLAERYPTHEAYRERVVGGAAYAASRRWILERDRRTYVRRATQLELGDRACPPWEE